MNNTDQIVEVGSIVTILFKGPSSKPLSISINPSRLRNRNGLVYIKLKTPLAQAILNRGAGEKVEFDSPEGKLKVKILKVL